MEKDFEFTKLEKTFLKWVFWSNLFFLSDNVSIK